MSRFRMHFRTFVEGACSSYSRVLYLALCVREFHVREQESTLRNVPITHVRWTDKPKHRKTAESLRDKCSL